MKRPQGLSPTQMSFARVVRTLDIGLMAGILFASLALSSGSLALPSLAYLLVIRIKVLNLFLLVGFLWLSSAVLSASGFYRSHRLSTFQQRLHEVLLAASLLTLFLLVLRWPFRLDFASNKFLIIFWVLTFLVLAVTREMAQRLLSMVRSRGRNVRNVVIIAEGDDVESLAQYMASEPTLGYRVVATIDAKEGERNDRYASAV